MMSVKRRESGEDSLSATMLGTSASRSSVFDVDVDPVRGWVVVEHDGERRGAGDGAEMVLELRCRRHVHHRRQHHEPAGADALGVAREARRGRGGQLADARNDRYLALARLDRALEHPALLRGAQGITLTHRAHEHQPLYAIADQRRLHAPRGGEIDVERCVELRRRRGKYTRPVASVSCATSGCLRDRRSYTFAHVVSTRPTPGRICMQCIASPGLDRGSRPSRCRASCSAAAPPRPQAPTRGSRPSTPPNGSGARINSRTMKTRRSPIQDHLPKVDPATQAHAAREVAGHARASSTRCRASELSPAEQLNYAVYRPQIETLIANQQLSRLRDAREFRHHASGRISATPRDGRFEPTRLP